jgi:hypothetical protein
MQVAAVMSHDERSPIEGRDTMSRSLLMSTWAAILLLACESGTAPESPAAGEDAVPLGPEFAARPNPSFQPFAFTVPTCGESVDLSGTFHQVGPQIAIVRDLEP